MNILLSHSEMMVTPFLQCSALTIKGSLCAVCLSSCFCCNSTIFPHANMMVPNQVLTSITIWKKFYNYHLHPTYHSVPA